jgi:hypothetical protein
MSQEITINHHQERDLKSDGSGTGGGVVREVIPMMC